LFNKEQEGANFDRNHQNDVELRLHKAKVKAYNKMKATFIEHSNDQDVLVLEFDYAQNLPLPKLPVNDQFYKRLLWFFVFNVHIHSHEKYFMFTFLEGKC